MTGNAPSIPPCAFDDLVARLADIKKEAGNPGFRTLAFCLDMALVDALAQADLLAKGCSEADLDPVSYGARES